MSPEVIEFFSKQVSQLGLPTVTLGLIVFVLYKVCIRILIPTAERLIDGHLAFLKDLKAIIEKEAADLSSIKNENAIKLATLQNIERELLIQGQALQKILKGMNHA